ncbi:hypothetical protein CF319_g7476, partial [Tilletia indica]
TVRGTPQNSKEFGESTLAIVVQAAPSPAGQAIFSLGGGLPFKVTNDIPALSAPKFEFGLQHDGQRVEQDEQTVWELINSNPHFSQLAHVLNYSSDATKERLNSSKESITLFAPVNWRRSNPHGQAPRAIPFVDDTHVDEKGIPSIIIWDAVLDQIHALEGNSDAQSAKPSRNHEDSDDDDDDKDCERRRRALAHIIDLVLSYHIVVPGPGQPSPLSLFEIGQNSSVATELKFDEDNPATKYVGKVFAGQALRLRTGKTLLPIPGVILNFYSRVVWGDIGVSNGVIHAIRFPLFIAPSALQGLFYGVNEYSQFLVALQKIDADKYLSLPELKKASNKRQHGRQHGRSSHALQQFAALEPFSAMLNSIPSNVSAWSEHGERHEGHHKNPYAHPAGSNALTVFAPSNNAWNKLPWAFKAYLFSPHGEDLLAKVLMFHSVRDIIFFADAVHYGKARTQAVPSRQYTVDCGSLVDFGLDDTVEAAASAFKDSFEGVSWPDMPWSRRPSGKNPSPTPGNDNGKVQCARGTSANVTEYELPTVLPKNPYDTPKNATEFEMVHVKVYRYYILKGPWHLPVHLPGLSTRQTRITVQGVPVLFQDGPVLNGVVHLLHESLLKPDGHPQQGIWARIAAEASRLGFGDVDLVREAEKGGW